MTTNTNMPRESSSSSYVYQEIQDMPTESSVVCQEIEDMLGRTFQGLQVSCLETCCKKRFKRSLDYKSLGVENIEQLLDKMCNKGMVHFYEDPHSCERYVTTHAEIDLPTEMPREIEYKPMDVYDKVQYIAAGLVTGATMSEIEKVCHQRFAGPLDYGSVGVNNIEELIGKMRDNGRVLVLEEPERKEIFVVCAQMAQALRKNLKLDVKYLLYKHDGKIPLSRFEAMFEAEFYQKFNYYQYGLTGPDHLFCQVLNVVLEEGDSDSPGEKVIKAIHNLRKRKIDSL